SKHLARCDEAELLYLQALVTLEIASGPRHPDVAGLLHNLAGLAHARGDHVCASELARRGLDIRGPALGDDPPDVAADGAALAPIVHALGDLDEAEHLLVQVLVAYERTF